jgi:hypothetical protein
MQAVKRSILNLDCLRSYIMRTSSSPGTVGRSRFASIRDCIRQYQARCRRQATRRPTPLVRGSFRPQLCPRHESHVGGNLELRVHEECAPVVVNAASFSQPISPGSFVTVYGQNLADTTTDWSAAITNGKLPTSLGGVQVLINGKNAYVYYVQPTQVNAIAQPDTNKWPT